MGPGTIPEMINGLGGDDLEKALSKYLNCSHLYTNH